MPAGYVNLTIVDNGGATVLVPQNSVQVVMGPAGAGTNNTVVSTRSLTTLQNTFTGGPLVEYSALSINAGGTVLAVKTAVATKGYVVGAAAPALTVSSASSATPIVVTTTTAHNLITGHVVTIASNSETPANGTYQTTVLSSVTFSLTGTVGTTVGTGGTAQPTGVVYTGTGTLVPTISLDSTNGCWDDGYVQLTFQAAGIVNSTQLQFTVSLDANRNTGPTIVLSSSTLTYAIPNTGVTVNLPTGQTVGNGDIIRFATAMPAWNTAGVLAALNAISASPYANTGWGSTVLLGVVNGANASTFEIDLDNIATNDYLYTRMIEGARDVNCPQAWGGATAPESESTWMTSIIADYAATQARRICANGGFYNMPSAITNSAAGAPSYRRNLGWALGCRQVAIPPQRHAGRVRDGNLGNIVVNPSSDPTDGFVYHDERLNPGLNAGRFSCATTRIPNLPGYYILQPNLMSPAGSQFGILPLGNVIDVGSSIVVQEAQQVINSDVRTNADGTIYVNDALTIQNSILNPLRANMLNQNMISGVSVLVDQTNDVAETSTVNISTTFNARGYVETIDASIQYAQE